MGKQIIFLLLAGLLFSCTTEHCLTCTETSYRDEVVGKITNGGYLYNTVLIREITSIECTGGYTGPYIINGQAGRPDDGKDFYWILKICK